MPNAEATNRWHLRCWRFRKLACYAFAIQLLRVQVVLAREHTGPDLSQVTADQRKPLFSARKRWSDDVLGVIPKDLCLNEVDSMFFAV